MKKTIYATQFPIYIYLTYFTIFWGVLGIILFLLMIKNFNNYSFINKLLIIIFQILTFILSIFIFVYKNKYKKDNEKYLFLKKTGIKTEGRVCNIQITKGPSYSNENDEDTANICNAIIIFYDKFKQKEIKKKTPNLLNPPKINQKCIVFYNEFDEFFVEFI